ncbi:hypothetical protein FPV67DRAFT_1418211 [Lyophyllum atratum]|nr:hypothetical protein FPV67DRAFT_1418211 [Lyophyllum atratum]
MRFDELLFRDSRDRVTGFEERRIDDDLWIGLNGAVDTIPIEAASYRDRSNYHAANSIVNPNGSYLDMDWGAHPDWFDLKHHWRGYMPVSDGLDISAPWFARFQRPVPLHVSPDGEACIDLSVNMEMIRDLNGLQDLVEDRRISGGAGVMEHFPEPFDTDRIHQIVETERLAMQLQAEAKRAALDAVGFLTWWRSCFPGRAGHFDAESPDYLGRFDLTGMRKRGMLVDLERDWRALDFEVLIKHDVPLFYCWTAELASDNRFARFDPAILRAFHTGELTINTLLRAPTPAEVFALASYERLASHDSFLLVNRFTFEDNLPYGDPARRNVKYFITDFPGWRRRPIRDRTRLWLMSQEFAGVTLRENSGDVIVYHRWQPREPDVDDPIDLGSDTGHESESDERSTFTDPEDLHELREWFKDPYAPVRGECIDDVTGLPAATEPRVGGSLLERISDDQPGGSGPPEDHSQPASDTATERGRSPPFFMTTLVESTWTRRMAGSPQRNVPHSRGQRASSPRRAEDASYSGAGAEASADRETFIESFRRWGVPYTNDGRMYDFPSNGVQWNPALLHHAWLIIDRPEVEVRMRYHAATTPGVRHIRDVLEYAIEKGLRFRLGVQLADMGKFRPSSSNISALDRSTGRQPHQLGFQEEVLTWGLGGTAFKINYLGKMGAVLNRAHSGALVGRGGGLSWIAQTFGGPEIVQKFINGPSTTMSWHNSSESDSTSTHPCHAHYDFVSPAEEALVLGYIPNKDSDHERWVFPPESLLVELCDFWVGEWTPRIDGVFRAIKREIDEDRIRARNRHEWRAYFRRGNRRYQERERTLDNDAADEGHRRLVDAFGRSWGSQQLWTLELPERYGSLARQKKGGFVRRR